MGSIRIIKNAKSTSYHAEVRLTGQDPQCRTFKSRTLAKQWIQQTETEIRDRKYFKKVDTSKITVKNLLDRFIDYLIVRKKNTNQSKLKWWKDRLGHLYLHQLRPSVIAEARDALLWKSNGRGGYLNVGTVNRYLNTLSKACTIAVREWEWLEVNPLKNVTFLKEDASRDRFLSVAEKDALLTACLNSKNKHLHSIVSLAILTGMRYSEIINLTYRDIDFERRIITLQKTKTGRHYIPISNPTEEVLRLCIYPEMEPNTKLFETPRQDNKTGTYKIRRAFMTALKEANIKGFRFHDLRHTALKLHLVKKIKIQKIKTIILA